LNWTTLCSRYGGGKTLKTNSNAGHGGIPIRVRQLKSMLHSTAQKVPEREYFDELPLKTLFYSRTGTNRLKKAFCRDIIPER
jgi:hypothetical protein